MQSRTIIRSLVRSGAVFAINGSLRDELLNEEIFDTLDDARRKLALWRYDYNAVRPHSSLGNQTPLAARRTLEQFEGSAPGALAKRNRPDYQSQTRRLSL
ncbi:Integrase core domain-containing protein [Tranquillimonas alkanivorans]|uniref:Integrase core domain-containing protein n=1 Tax=Tranquillimonas alkanivorans TaxID=441119 RepID=A0A1I5W4U0_9RHOB|nr:Integrase core domain-containing protein [Tranquillimonas alkanivorans]